MSNSEKAKKTNRASILGRITNVKNRLGETGRDDHLEEVISWEKKAGAALIRLSIEGNLAVKQLATHARERIVAINHDLRNEKDEPLGPEAAQAAHNNRLVLMRERALWQYFLSFFDEAHDDLDDIEKKVAEQEESPVEAGKQPVIDDDFVGQV